MDYMIVFLLLDLFIFGISDTIVAYIEVQRFLDERRRKNKTLDRAKRRKIEEPTPEEKRAWIH